MTCLRLAAALMVKNEEKRICITLESVKHIIDGIILYDTGSNDNTIDVVKEFAKNNNLGLNLLRGEFEDFATSRNKMLEFADYCSYDYILLLDSNDEYKCQSSVNIKELLADKTKDCLYVNQQWYIGHGNVVSYYNIRIIKPHKGFRYIGSVHEYIQVPDNAMIDRLQDVILYQDRIKDNDGKSETRWRRDLHALKKDLALNPNNTRTQFYLAQTYDCLNNKDKAMTLYKQRSKTKDGFFEERFQAMMRCGDMEYEEDEQVKWYLKSFQIIERAEPLVKIARIYRKRNSFTLAYTFSKLACDLKFPSQCLLWVNRKCYDHDRWQELGIVAYYLEAYDVGKNACEKAIESGYDLELNHKNLVFYEKNVVR